MYINVSKYDNTLLLITLFSCILQSTLLLSRCKDGVLTISTIRTIHSSRIMPIQDLEKNYGLSSA